MPTMPGAFNGQEAEIELPVTESVGGDFRPTQGGEPDTTVTVCNPLVSGLQLGHRTGYSIEPLCLFRA